MVQFRAANLKDVVSRAAVTGKPIYASVENAIRDDWRKRIEQLNDYMQALASNQAGSSAPTPSVRGELWADTSTAGATTLYLEPDGEGYDDNVATRLTAKGVSFKGPGTSQTFKPGGAIDVNTTQVSVISAAGDFMSYPVPGNTINANNSTVEQYGFFTSNGAVRLGYYFNGQIVFDHNTFSFDDAFAKNLIVRTSSSTAKIFTAVFLNNDTGASDEKVKSATVTGIDFSQSIPTKFTRENSAAGTHTQEIMLTRYLP